MTTKTGNPSSAAPDLTCTWSKNRRPEMYVSASRRFEQMRLLNAMVAAATMTGATAAGDFNQPLTCKEALPSLLSKIDRRQV